MQLPRNLFFVCWGHSARTTPTNGRNRLKLFLKQLRIGPTGKQMFMNIYFRCSSFTYHMWREFIFQICFPILKLSPRSFHLLVVYFSAPFVHDSNSGVRQFNSEGNWLFVLCEIPILFGEGWDCSGCLSFSWDFLGLFYAKFSAKIHVNPG